MIKIYTSKNLECLAKEILNFLHGLSPTIMNGIFEARVNICNVTRNFQSLYSFMTEAVIV